MIVILSQSLKCHRPSSGKSLFTLPPYHVFPGSCSETIHDNSLIFSGQLNLTWNLCTVRLFQTFYTSLNCGICPGHCWETIHGKCFIFSGHINLTCGHFDLLTYDLEIVTVNFKNAFTNMSGSFSVSAILSLWPTIKCEITWLQFDIFVMKSRQDETEIWLKVVSICSATVFRQLCTVICLLSLNYLRQISIFTLWWVLGH